MRTGIMWRWIGRCVLMAVLAVAVSCTKIDDNRTPTYMVNIRLDSHALWSTYGVSGMGDYRIFIRDKQQPRNFPYTANTYTGFGGVLLLVGYDFTTQSYGVPVAYDIACPYENKQSVTVTYDSKNLEEAYCPSCGSRYNVLEGGGAASSGPAYDRHYGLKRYSVVASSNGGYVIGN